MATERKCERCDTREADTEAGMLALNGQALVCSDCDSALNDEWHRDYGGIHPLDALNPVAGLFA